ncbi:hypothetical protein Tco_1100708 [Tanacetum coccineum]
MGIDYAGGGRLGKLRPDEAWATIQKLAQYEDEGWNNTLIPEVGLNYENPNIKHLLGVMERKVDTLMKDAVSLMGRSEGVFRMTTNKMYRPPSEPSRLEEFEHIVMNFILDQEESKRQRSIRGQSSSSQELSIEEKTSLTGNSLLAKTSTKHSLTSSTPTASPGLNGEIFSASMSPFIENWFMSSLLHLSLMPLLIGRKETTHRVTKVDLYYLYCIYTLAVACNIPYWLSKYLKAMRDKNLIYGGMLVTKIDWSFGLLTDELRDALTMVEEEEAEEEDEWDEGHDRARGSTAMDRNMSQGDWQVSQARWMDQQDEQQGRLNT